MGDNMENSSCKALRLWTPIMSVPEDDRMSDDILASVPDGSSSPHHGSEHQHQPRPEEYSPLT